MKKEISLAVAIIIMVIIGGGAFYSGMQYQKSVSVKTRVTALGARAGQAGPGGQFSRSGVAGGARGFGGGAVAGQILSTSDAGITVKMRDGSSKIVIIGNSATINKSTSGTKTDLTTGEQVMVIGTTNSDGSVTATNINIQPAPIAPTPAGQ